MIQKKYAVIASIGFLLLLSCMDSAFAADKLVIVANRKSLDLAKDFISTLNNESIPISVALDQYDKVKKEKYIFVLGGADAFTRQVLTKEDMDAANQAGGKIFVRQDLFAQGQIIVVFAGKDEESAANARKNNRKTWWTLITKWFELETSGPMAY
jgi:ribosomal protein L24E